MTVPTLVLCPGEKIVAPAGVIDVAVHRVHFDDKGRIERVDLAPPTTRTEKDASA